jgi:hypothetical protein
MKRASLFISGLLLGYLVGLFAGMFVGLEAAIRLWKLISVAIPRAADILCQRHRAELLAACHAKGLTILLKASTHAHP